MQGGTHPFPGFGDRLIRQADNPKGGQALGNLNLNINGANIDPFKRDGVNAGNHGKNFLHKNRTNHKHFYPAMNRARIPGQAGGPGQYSRD
jgi:hypothetical protein